MNPDPQVEVEVEAGTAAERAAEDNVLSVHEQPGGLRAALEAVLMVADEPIGPSRLAAGLQVPVDEVETALRVLSADYEREQRGFDLAQVAGGWRFYSRSAWAPVVERFLLDGQSTRLSAAALETLAVIAYRQPVSRSRVAAVRGVAVDAVFRTLRSRALIEEVGTDETTGAALYATTDLFLELMGLQDLGDLPALAPLLPDLDALAESERAI